MSIAKNIKEDYKERIIPAMMKEFGYTSTMQVPHLVKIVISRGLGDEHEDKKLIEIAANELAMITGQKAVITRSKKDISNFKLRKGMPVGAMVTLRRGQMYDFLDRLINIALPRIRDFKGLETRMDSRGNYTFGVDEQIIFPEINLDTVPKILGMNITIVTSAETDEEGYALLREFGLPFKKNTKSKKATK